MSNRTSVLLLLAIGVLSQTAFASTIYQINRSIGPTGTITGTIETDGTQGTLSASNILDWNLVLNVDANTAAVGNLRGPLSGNNSSFNAFPQTALSVSGNALSFNFGTVTTEIFQLAVSDGTTVWQMQAGVPFQDELVRESWLTSSPLQINQVRGPVTQVLGVAPVPLPAAAWLLLSGLGGLGALRRKRAAAA